MQNPSMQSEIGQKKTHTHLRIKKMKWQNMREKSAHEKNVENLIKMHTLRERERETCTILWYVYEVWSMNF